MPRPLRVDYPGALHHVIFKGNEGRVIFWEDRDREEFLKMLKELTRRYRFILYAYCLMDNHVHLLIETAHEPLSRFMQRLLTRYVQWFNKRHNRSGHLLGDRYKSILVDKDRYFLAVLRYIHLNPVRARMVSMPEDYPWSSYREYLGEAKIVSTALGLSYFSSLDEFIDFTLSGIEEGLPEVKKVQDYLVYADDDFVHQVLEMLEKERRKREGGGRIPVEEVDGFLKERYGKALENIERFEKGEIKGVAVVLLRDRAHLTWREIGEVWGSKPSSVREKYLKMEAKVKDAYLLEFDRWREKINKWRGWKWIKNLKPND